MEWVTLALWLPAIVLGGGGLVTWFRYRNQTKREGFQDYFTSFEKQIESAEKRGGDAEANRLRQQYEREQEAWRAQQTLELIAPQRVDVESSSLSPPEIDQLREMLANSAEYPAAAVSAGGHFLRGNAYYETGQYDRAIDEFSISLRLDPDNSPTYYNRGTAYFQKGDYDKAIEDYNQAVEVDPKLQAAYYNRGTAHINKGDYNGAIEDLNHAIELNPNDASAYYNRGNAYYQRGDYDKAIEDFDYATKLDPKEELAYRNRGTAHMKKGDYDRAIEDFNHALEFDPREASPYYNKACLYSLAHDADESYKT